MNDYLQFYRQISAQLINPSAYRYVKSTKPHTTCYQLQYLPVPCTPHSSRSVLPETIKKNLR